MGLFERAGSVMRALRVYFLARTELFALEMREAAHAIILRVALLSAALVLALFAWGILIASTIKLIADLSGMDWKYAGFIVAGAHLLLVVILVWAARKGPPLFEATRMELEKDKAWLASRHEPSGNEKPN